LKTPPRQKRVPLKKDPNRLQTFKTNTALFIKKIIIALRKLNFIHMKNIDNYEPLFFSALLVNCKSENKK
jgi:hypothetical protein